MVIELGNSSPSLAELIAKKVIGNSLDLRVDELFDFATNRVDSRMKT